MSLTAGDVEKNPGVAGRSPAASSSVYPHLDGKGEKPDKDYSGGERDPCHR